MPAPKFPSLARFSPRLPRWIEHRSLLAALLVALLTSLALTPAGAQVRRPAPPPKPVCVVADFRSLALQTHHPQERANAATAWLRANGSACTLAQLNTLASNRAAWLGNADSPPLMGLIDGLLENLEAKNASKAVVAAVPSSAAPASGALAAAARPPAGETTSSGTPPARTNPPGAATAPAIPAVIPVVPAPPAGARP